MKKDLSLLCNSIGIESYIQISPIIMVFRLSIYLSSGSSNLSLILSYQIYAQFIFDIWDLTIILQFFK